MKDYYLNLFTIKIFKYKIFYKNNTNWFLLKAQIYFSEVTDYF